jgi:hypothetical protein
VKTRALVSGFLVVSSVGCGDAPPPNVAPLPSAAPTATASATSTATAPAPAPTAYVPAPPRYENPGGMWMPNQMAAHAAKLKELGLGFDPAQLADPTSDVLGAVVSLGGCSASFVSPSGLVITNHHCAVGALQLNSSAAANLLKDGYIAKTRADEKSNGPTARVFVTQKVTDVTKQVWDMTLASHVTDRERFKLIEKRQKALVAECEKDRPGTRCTVSTFYDGAAYYLIEQLELRDIRLVYAPAEGVGNYGGEIDNWRWPRHTGDVSMFRAYVGKDGKPADYSPDNVPYVPAHHLKLAQKGLEENDLVFVAGYPGRTHSLKSRAEVEDFVTFRYPRTQKLCEDRLAALEKITDKEAALRATPFVRWFGNTLTNTKGMLEGLVKDGLLQQKVEREAAFTKFIEADPARKKRYAPVLAEIAKAYEDARKHRESDAELRSEFLLPRLVGAAYQIVRMAEERPKADKERDPDYQERNWPRLTQGQEAMEKQYSRIVDMTLFNLALARHAKADPKERAPVDAILRKLFPVNPNATPYKPPVSILFEDTRLEDTKTRVQLLKTATLADLKKSQDPMIRFALALRPLVKEADERDEALSGHMAYLKPTYFEALRAFEGHEIAPDANGTLRITYGTVRSYRPKKDAPYFAPFTLLPEVVAKNTGKEPFDAPPKLIAAYTQKKFGSYVDKRWGQVPVDFLADLQISGGNSGSATLNAKGEITGLVFDGNYEALASDWLFKPELTRSIHVDIRYVLWLLDAVDGGDHLIREMGGTPSVD